MAFPDTKNVWDKHLAFSTTAITFGAITGAAGVTTMALPKFLNKGCDPDLCAILQLEGGKQEAMRHRIRPQTWAHYWLCEFLTLVGYYRRGKIY